MHGFPLHFPPRGKARVALAAQGDQPEICSPSTLVPVTEPDPAQLPTATDQGSTETSMPGFTIRLVRTLVIDPDPASAEPLLAILRGRGHECSHSPSFASVRKSPAELDPPDCLILRLDHTTAPEAAEFLRFIRDRGDQSHLIALTRTEESPSRVEAWLKRGFDEFLPDPETAGASTVGSRLAVIERTVMRRRERARHAMESLRFTRRFEDIFLRSPDAALVVTAREGLIVEANAAAEDVLGVRRRDLVQRFLSLVLPDLFEREDFDARILTVPHTLRLSGLPHRKPDGSLRSLDVFITRIPWAPGQALLLNFIDRTDALGREARLLHEARMDAAARSMGGAARELTDALTSLRGHLDLLQRQPFARQEIRDLIAAVAVSCDRTEGVAHQLTGLARAPRGHDLRRQPVSLRLLTEKAVAFALLGGKARMTCQLPSDLWPIAADESRLAEAFACLARNADDAMESGGTLHISAHNADPVSHPDSEGKQGVLITFRDEGHGIHADHLPRVFDPWFTTRAGRPGMGLTLAGSIVRAHGGHLSIASNQGAGTTVTLWLPATPAESAGTTTPENPAPTAKRHRVLFMDDEAPIREVVSAMLSTHGFDVHCTATADETVAAWSRAHEFGAPFDLLLADLDIRGGPGACEVMTQLRSRFPHIRAILTSGYADDEIMESFRSHGFLGILSKPFQMERLVQSVRQLLGS